MKFIFHIFYIKNRFFSIFNRGLCEPTFLKYSFQTDGNTVSCCENSGVKDQNGNDLRLCSAIDEERVYEENKKNEESKHILVHCESRTQYQTSKGYRFRTINKYHCIDNTGKDVLKICGGCVFSSCNLTVYMNECNASSTIKASGRFPLSEENEFFGDKVAIQVCFPN